MVNPFNVIVAGDIMVLGHSTVRVPASIVTGHVYLIVPSNMTTTPQYVPPPPTVLPKGMPNGRVAATKSAFAANAVGVGLSIWAVTCFTPVSMRVTDTDAVVTGKSRLPASANVRFTSVITPTFPAELVVIVPSVSS